MYFGRDQVLTEVSPYSSARCICMLASMPATFIGQDQAGGGWAAQIVVAGT